MSYLFTAAVSFAAGAMTAFLFVRIVSNLKAAALLEEFYDLGPKE